MTAATVFDLSFTDNHGEVVDLSRYEGKALLIVNTASACGFTPQYAGLEQLHETYGARGLVVIGFPCDEFGHQEPGDDGQIEQFCQLNYGVTFPLSTKVEVNGGGTHPVFSFVRERSNSPLGSLIKWNFTKFLVAPDGRTVTRYAPSVVPAELVPAIEAVLPVA